MAAPNTNTSDLDRANATITKLVSHLDNFKQVCETPDFNPSIHDSLQQLRIGVIDEDLENIRQDLDSVRTRLVSAAVDSALNTAEREEKQATLDRAIQAAERRERDAKKTEESLVMAITYAREKEADADKKMAEAVRKEVEADKKMAEAEKMMIAAQRESDAAVVDQSKADSELAGMESMRASFEADFQQRSQRLQEEEKQIMQRLASISSSEARLTANQQSHKKFELMTRERMEEANTVMQCAQEEREAAQRNLDTAVAIDRITSGAGDSVNSNSMDKMLRQADHSIRGSIDRLSSAATNISRELAEVSVGMGDLKVATQAAKTLTSDLGLLQRVTRKLVADVDSAEKRPLSSGGEPTGKRARSAGPFGPTGSQLDEDPSANVSGGRMIMSPGQLRTSVTPGPSGSTAGPSGPSNQPSLSTEAQFKYGLHPGDLVCPADIRLTDEETQRVWAQISFGTEWTMTDSIRLLEDFNTFAAKGVPRQMPQSALDRCADAAGKNDNCLLQNIRKLGSSWNQGEDKATKQCKECTKKSQICIRVLWLSMSHGEYNRDATNVKRWNVTKRQS